MWVEGLAWVEFLEVWISVQLDQAGAVDVSKWDLLVAGVGSINPGVLVRIHIKAVLHDVEVVAEEDAWALQWVAKCDWNNLKIFCIRFALSLLGKLKGRRVEWLLVLALNFNFVKTTLFINPQEAISDWLSQVGVDCGGCH